MTHTLTGVGARGDAIASKNMYKKLKSLSRGVVEEDKQRLSESNDTNYAIEEENIFTLSKEVTDLIANLQNRKNKNETKAQ